MPPCRTVDKDDAGFRNTGSHSRDDEQAAAFAHTADDYDHARHGHSG